MTEIFALTTRGLENLSAAELQTVKGIRVLSTAYRRVMCEFSGSLAPLLNLKTVDDTFIKVAEWTGLTHERSALAKIRDLSGALNLKAHLPILLALRPIPRAPTFSVTANFVGRRNYTMPEIKIAAAEALSRRYLSWHYSEDDGESDLNLRIFIEQDAALVGLRIGARPLHRRAYKQMHLPGSLKPTVAAAMAILAGVKPGQSLLDPFCGSGTILVEASQMGIVTLGGDVSAEAVISAGANILEAGQKARVCHWDARMIPLASASINCAVTNLPWGRQIMVDDDLRTLYRVAMAEMRRVLKPEGAIVVLTSAPELLESDGAPVESLEISLFGQNPVIVRYEVS